jgi:hypothetical protein
MFRSIIAMLTPKEQEEMYTLLWLRGISTDTIEDITLKCIIPHSTHYIKQYSVVLKDGKTIQVKTKQKVKLIPKRVLQKPVLIDIKNSNNNNHNI